MAFTNHDCVREVSISATRKGLAARKRIERGTIIGIRDGRIQAFALESGRLDKGGRSGSMVQIAIQDGQLFGLVDQEQSGIACINHSCDPNVLARDQIVLIAARDILEGEALTIDFRTWQLVPDGVPCSCAEPRCRI